MGKRYVIKYKEIFETGYVKYHVYQSGKTYDFVSNAIALKCATKFRFKWVADLLCWNLNKSTKDFKIFEVIEFHKINYN